MAQPQDPPVARVVRGAGGPLARLRAHARHDAIRAGRLAGKVLRVGIVGACVFGVLVALGMASGSRPRPAPNVDLDRLLRSLEQPRFDWAAQQRMIETMIQHSTQLAPHEVRPRTR